MGHVRWTPDEVRRRLQAVARHWRGVEPAWTLVAEELHEHPETGQPPMFFREWRAEGAHLLERGAAGPGNPRDGYGWTLHFELGLDPVARPGEPRVLVEVLGGDWACVITDDAAYARGATPDEAAKIQAWLREP